MMTRSPAARTALIYVTAGALTMIWTGVWFLYMAKYPPDTEIPYYFCGGLMATGLTVLILGLVVGRIGRSAQHAELPPPELQAPPPDVQINTPAAPTISAPAASAGPALATSRDPGEPRPINTARPSMPVQPPVSSV
jgi:hypothetical protein